MNDNPQVADNESKKGGTLLRKLMRPVDLTVGTPWKRVLRYGAPIMLSYLLQQIYVLTDAIICGQVLSAGEVAGVNDTFPLTFIFLQFAFGCTAGFGVITAKHVGVKDAEGVRRSFASQIYLSVIISIVLTVLSISLLPQLLGLINVTQTNKVVYDAAYSYCLIIFAGIITQMGYNFICGVLRAYGDSVTPLIFLVISTALNVGLDVLFLTAFRMGAAGAAIATVITQFLSMIGCFIYTFVKYKDLRLKKADLKSGAYAMWAHLKQGIPLGLQFSVLAVGIIVMQGVIVRFDVGENGVMVAGTPAQNGYGAGSKLFNFLISFYNGLGAAILGFNAQCFGKGDLERVKKGTVQAIVIAVIIHFICLAVAMLACINGAYQYVFMSADKINAETIRYGNTFVYVDLSLFFIVGFLIVVRSAVQGVCKAGYVLGAGIAELVARSAICTFLPPFVNGSAINSAASHGAYVAACFGDPGAWICASLLLCIPLFKNILRKKY